MINPTVADVCPDSQFTIGEQNGRRCAAGNGVLKLIRFQFLLRMLQKARHGGGGDLRLFFKIGQNRADGKRRNMRQGFAVRDRKASTVRFFQYAKIIVIFLFFAVCTNGSEIQHSRPPQFRYFPYYIRNRKKSQYKLRLVAIQGVLRRI